MLITLLRQNVIRTLSEQMRKAIEKILFLTWAGMLS